MMRIRYSKGSDNNTKESSLPNDRGDDGSNHKRNNNGGQNSRFQRIFQESKKPFSVSRVAIVTFGVAGVIFLFGVHVLLLKNVMSTSETEYHHHGHGGSPNPLHPIQLHPLSDKDREQYTIRINTWKRLEQLEMSINHHETCPGVAQIQVVWCTEQGEPPARLEKDHPKVVVERHEVNSLNERFNVLISPPTLGILSMDDDVMRPCEAIDSGFFLWTQHPHRMVGFDARSHTKYSGKWSYAYMSTTQQTNQYSMTLARYSFLHRDYLHYYMKHLPRSIFSRVAEKFNCEDIAMSFMISSLLDGKPPLLADYWAVTSMVKLYSEARISGDHDHKSTRDTCVDKFATRLGLKTKLHHTHLFHQGHLALFGYGEIPSDQRHHTEALTKSKRLAKFEEHLEHWKEMDSKHFLFEMTKRRTEMAKEAFLAGLLEKTPQWEARWKKKKGDLEPDAEHEDIDPRAALVHR